MREEAMIRSTMAFDGEAVLDEALWARAERLYRHECLESSISLDKLATWAEAGLRTRLYWWERAFDEMCMWSGDARAISR